MYDAGIPILAGTDALAGLMLHRELELEVKAGIPAAKALQIATWKCFQIAETRKGSWIDWAWKACRSRARGRKSGGEDQRHPAMPGGGEKWSLLQE